MRWPGCVIEEYTAVRMSHDEAERVTSRRAAQGIHDEYQLSITGVDIVIDGMGQTGDGKFANHSCLPNARYSTIRLRGSTVDVVFIEALVTIREGTEVVVDYHWSVVEAKELVTCECATS